ncbi:MAG TPA: hypothetical protein VHE36_04585 [Sphingomicrobium sp.]|jgi:hypothetical protein|nr:hypothetical protein [Sphingomicrobium sp.]
MRKVCPDKEINIPDDTSADLKRRLARYRKRVEAEGRNRSVELLDRAIRDAARDTESHS